MKHVHADRYKKTKIIATIGPATEGKIEELLASGVNGIRLNLSHNTHEWHAKAISRVRTAAKKLDRSVAIIWDLQGPKIRIGEVEGMIELKAGDQIKLSEKATDGSDVIAMQYKDRKSVV